MNTPPNSPNLNPGEIRANRASRYQRAAEEKRKRIHLTQLDREILEIVGRARFIDASQIHALVGGNKTMMQVRLRKLFDARYLDRPIPQRILETKQGTAPLVYALGPRGADVVGETVKKNNDIGIQYLEHTLLVTKHYVTTEAACRHAGMRLDQWVNEPPFPPLTLPGFKKDVSHRADAMFTIEQDGITETFCLEVDRGTVPGMRSDATQGDQSNWWRTIHYYQELYRQREELLGVSNFRVLITTASVERIASLIELIKQADPKQRGLGIFWCTTHDPIQPAYAQSFLFDPLWAKPYSNPHPLFPPKRPSVPLSKPAEDIPLHEVLLEAELEGHPA